MHAVKHKYPCHEREKQTSALEISDSNEAVVVTRKGSTQPNMKSQQQDDSPTDLCKKLLQTLAWTHQGMYLHVSTRTIMHKIVCLCMACSTYVILWSSFLFNNPFILHLRLLANRWIWITRQKNVSKMGQCVGSGSSCWNRMEVNFDQTWTVTDLLGWEKDGFDLRYKNSKHLSETNELKILVVVYSGFHFRLAFCNNVTDAEINHSLEI